MRKKNRVDKTGKKHRNDENKAGNGQAPFSGFLHDIEPVIKGRLSMGLKRDGAGRDPVRPAIQSTNLPVNQPHRPQKKDAVNSKVKVIIMMSHLSSTFMIPCSIAKKTG
jgi:hypothetical protein